MINYPSGAQANMLHKTSELQCNPVFFKEKGCNSGIAKITLTVEMQYKHGVKLQMYDLCDHETTINDIFFTYSVHMYT